MLPLLPFLLPFLVTLVDAQAIQACPANAKTFTADDGSIYEYCPYTDYQTNTIQLFPNVPSEAACVQICNQYGSGCTRGVWDAYASYCHVKGAGGTWAISPKFDSLRLVSKGNQPVSGLSACPTGPTFYQAPSGAVYEICNNTDYQGNTNSIQWNLPDQLSCVQWCANNDGCILGIWDHVYKACHIKATTSITWAKGTTQFDAIRLIAPPAPQPQPAGFTTCPSATTRWTLDDGSVYEVCPNSDLLGNAYEIIPAVLSAWDCIRLCNRDTTCTMTVFDHQYLYCHLKSGPVTWVANGQFDVTRLIQRGWRQLTASTALGRWSAPIVVPANPVGAYIVPGTSRVLGFSSWGDDNFYGADGFTQFTDWDFQSGAVSERTIQNTRHNMFCPGIASLGSGVMMVNGGDDAARTSLYDPVANTFQPGADMNIARGYESSCTLSNGKVFTIGGSFSGGTGGKTGEIYDSVANAWAVLPGTDVIAAETAEAEYRSDNHMWLFGWKRGSVFQAGPSQKQNWFGTSGQGNTTYAGTRDTYTDAMCGMTVMYDAVKGKIWSGGGTRNYTDSDGRLTAHITTIGEPYQPSTVKQVADLPRARAFANSVALPDGTILVVGGQTRAIVFRDDASQFIADLYNPATNKWRSLAASKVPRNYHSTALLLADGTVFTGGGGLCWTAQGQSDAGCDRTADHPSIEIFSPPYLFNADGTYATRPWFASIASTTDGANGATAKPGDTLTIRMGDATAGVMFALLRTGSVTHTVNTDQRRVPLVAAQNGATWTMKLPNDYGVLLPGYYYLFAVNKAGVPSYGKTVQVV